MVEMGQRETCGPTPSLPDAGLQLSRRGNVGISAGRVARRLLGQSAIEEGSGILRSEPDCLIVVLNSAVVLTFVRVLDTAVDMEERKNIDVFVSAGRYRATAGGNRDI